MIAPGVLSMSMASEDERAQIDHLWDRLRYFSAANAMHESHYDGTFMAKRYGFSIPPNMSALNSVVGWGGTVVDVLEERLDWLGWRSTEDSLGLNEVYADNHLEVESGMGHLDALIYGTAFVAVGSGAEGEPSPLVTVQSPWSTTAEWDRRSRRVLRALVASGGDEVGGDRQVTLYTPEATTTFEERNGLWARVHHDAHRMGRCPIVRLPNRVRASDMGGRSEITPAVRYLSENAVRTLMGMEVHREFYQAPQRWAMNVDESAFESADGTPASPWKSIMGRVWAIPPNDDGQPAPEVGQFTASSPTPYIEQVRHLAQLLAAEAGLPSAYLGFGTDNPASADAIRAGESRLVKRAERRQASFGQAWMEVARLALLVRDGEVPPEFRDVSVRWRDAATPTRAASADEAVKLVGSGVLTPDSSVTYDRIGLDMDEQRVIEADKRRARGASVLERIAPPVTDADQ